MDGEIWGHSDRRTDSWPGWGVAVRGHASPLEAAVWAQSGCCAELQLAMPKGEREPHVALDAEGRGGVARGADGEESARESCR